jgi:hypothetical protein
MCRLTDSDAYQEPALGVVHNGTKSYKTGNKSFEEAISIL